MHFSKSLQGSKSAIAMCPVSKESTFLLFLLIQNFLAGINMRLSDSYDNLHIDLRFYKNNYTVGATQE